jgi:hypothetical protein
MLICSTCRQALDPTPKFVINHFNEKHCEKGKTIERLRPGLGKSLQEALGAITFADPREIRHQPHDQPPIPGIHVGNGFYCPMTKSDGQPCIYTAGKTSSIDTHIKRTHQGDKSRPQVKDLENYPCCYQTLFTGNLKRFFRVRTGLTGLMTHPEGSHNPYSAFILQAKTALSPDFHPEPIKDDELPSLLRATRWNTFLEPYRKCPDDVVGLVQFPAARHIGIRRNGSSLEKVLSRLPDVSEVWMDTVHGYWSVSRPYIHRILARCPM